MTVEVEPLLLHPGSSTRDAVETIDRNRLGIALLVDDARRLVATITDGDIRRAMLAGIDLDSPVETLVDRQKEEPYPRPLTAPAGSTASDLLALMTLYTLRHIPIVDEERRVIDLALLHDLVEDTQLPVRAVVMAGGFGTRLGELTEHTPKPMLPVGDRPLLERIVDQLREAGIQRVNMTTHFKSDVISDHFGDGREFGVEINYVNEQTPLGTAGAISLLEASTEPLLVMNGDILTRVDLRAMVHYHQEHLADMTVAIWPYELRVPHGVIETADGWVTSITEKPVIRSFVNAGIYLLNPHVAQLVPHGERFDMPQLIERLIEGGHKVASFPLREYWLDIGQADDYQRAIFDVHESES